MSEKREIYGIIYKITSPSGKHYIGQTTSFKRRMSRYKRDGSGVSGKKHQPKLTNAILKYGWSNMKVQILIECLSKQELDEMEIYFIGVYRCLTKGYNCESGGAHGKPSEETKEKMRQAKLGKKASKETRKRMSEAQMGRTAWNKGFSCSEQTKEKLRLANLGKTRTPEACAKISQSNKGKTASENTKKKMSESAKRNFSIEEWSKRGFLKTGEDRPSFDSTEFTFVNKKTGEIFIGHRLAFTHKTGIISCRISFLIKNKKNSLNGWQIKS